MGFLAYLNKREPVRCELVEHTILLILYKCWGKSLFGVILLKNTGVVNISLKLWFMLSTDVFGVGLKQVYVDIQS